LSRTPRSDESTAKIQGLSTSKVFANFNGKTGIGNWSLTISVHYFCTLIWTRTTNLTLGTSSRCCSRAKTLSSEPQLHSGLLSSSEKTSTCAWK
jgi:hypothetical protein